jgi:putative ABC transport system permease protein
MILRLILRELKSSPRFFFLFILNITIGLSGLAVIESFKGSFLTELQKNSKKILGADLSISARVDIAPKKIEDLGKFLPDTHSVKNISLFSMANVKENTRLVSVRVTGEGYPFYGEVKLRDGSTMGTPKDLNAYVYPEVLIQLQAKVGETLSLGETDFTIKGVVTDDGQQNFQMGSLAPRIYISKYGLKKAKLLQKGSTAWYSYHYKLPKDLSKSDKSKVVEILDDTSIEVKTPSQSTTQTGRVLTYLNDFLGLVSLSGLFLAIMGLMYLYRNFLYKRRKEISISKFLGITNSQIFMIYIGQLLVMSFVGAVLSAIVTPVILPQVISVFNDLLQMNLTFDISLTSLISPIVIGSLGTALIGLPLLMPYMKSDFRGLFSHEDNTFSDKSKWYNFLPLVIFFYVVAIYLSKSILIGSAFSFVLFASISIIFVVGNTLLTTLKRLSKSGKLENKLMWGFLTRFKTSTLFVFCTLMVSSMMMTIIPQIKDVLLYEVERPLKESGPTAFLFDIQEEQVSDLSNFLSSSGSELITMSPMVRSRLIKINGSKVKTSVSTAMTREEQTEVRMRNRGVNLSFRDSLDSSETLVDGVWPDSTYDLEKDSTALITLEKRYAQRLGVGIGDTLEFDILGITLISKIVGIREVQWTSFRPNFFILFQKGVLEDAPKTFLSAVRSPLEISNNFQTDLFNKFPNVSFVDIRRIVDKVKVIMNNMSLILRFMSYLVFFVGIMVLFSIISHQISMRKMNINLLKVLGLDKQRLSAIVQKEFLLISVSATFVGVLLSTVISFFLSKFVFTSVFVFEFTTVLTPLILIPFMSWIISILGTRSVLNSRAGEIFSGVN